MFPVQNSPCGADCIMFPVQNTVLVGQTVSCSLLRTQSLWDRVYHVPCSEHSPCGADCIMFPVQNTVLVGQTVSCSLFRTQSLWGRLYHVPCSEHSPCGADCIMLPVQNTFLVGQTYQGNNIPTLNLPTCLSSTQLSYLEGNANGRTFSLVLCGAAAAASWTDWPRVPCFSAETESRPDGANTGLQHENSWKCLSD
jgi:hypothetical protein